MKISMDDILLRAAMEKITGVSPKDCIVEGDLVSFLVPEQLMGKAIGKQAVNVKKLQETLKKRIELVPLYSKPEDVFSQSLEINYTAVKTNGNKLVITLDSANKSKAFKNNSRIRRVKELIERNFGLDLVIN
jgi:N utilization substance protein A